MNMQRPTSVVVRIHAVRHGYRCRRGRRSKGGCGMNWFSKRRMDCRARMGRRGKRGSREERAVGRIEEVRKKGQYGNR